LKEGYWREKDSASDKKRARRQEEQQGERNKSKEMAGKPAELD